MSDANPLTPSRYAVAYGFCDPVADIGSFSANATLDMGACPRKVGIVKINSWYSALRKPRSNRFKHAERWKPYLGVVELGVPGESGNRDSSSLLWVIILVD